MKRTLALILLLCLVSSLVLSACSFSPLPTQASANGLTGAKDYTTLIKSLQEMMKYQTATPNRYYLAGAPQESAAAADKTAGSSASSGYSQTNIQVEGVDEADLIKTDGQYLYLIASNRLYIVDARQPSQMTVVSSILFKAASETKSIVTGESVLEMFLDTAHNRLILLISGYLYQKDATTGSEPAVRDFAADKMMYPYQAGRNYTTTRVYDISDKSEPKLTRQFTQEGSYITARKIGDIVTVVTSKYQYRIMAMTEPAIVDQVAPAETAGSEPAAGSASSETAGADSTAETTETAAAGTDIKPEDVFPATTDSPTDGVWETVAPDQITLVKNGDPGNQVILASIDTVDDSQKPDLLAVIGTSGTVYCSTDYLYMLGWRTIYHEPADSKSQATYENYTDIYRYSLKDGQIKAAGEGTVPGSILNQFSLDEYNGYLRIATTTGEAWSGSANPSKNNIYILNSSLKRVGSVTGLAAGETIRSVRFIGDTGYVVTFRTTDPLFVLDLGTPSNPKVLGKLKIPGYSAYLHPYGEDRLLGIGYDVAVDGEIAYEKGLKVSLFDISDLSSPKELSTILLGSRGSYSDLTYNHKSLLFSLEKNLIAFPALLAKTTTDSRLEYGQPNFQGLIVLTVANDKLVLRGGVTHFDKFSAIDGPLQTFTENDMNAFYGYDAINRGAFIDDTLFTFSNRQVRASSLDTLAKVGAVELPGYDQQQYWGYGGGIADDGIMTK